MKKIIALVLTALMMLGFASCGSDSKKSTSSGEKKVLKVGLECAYAPFNWTQLDNSNGAVPISGTSQFAGGYDVEIAKKIAAGLNMELEIVKTTWEGLIPAVQTGVIDLIIAGMSPTDERKESIDFSEKYYTSDLVIVVKANGKYANAAALADFSGAKIVAQKGTFHAEVVKQITGVVEQTPLADFGTMITALQSGTVDGYVSERPGALSAVAANSEFKMISFEGDKGFTASEQDTSIAIGMKKNSELREKINEILSGISEEQRAQIMNNAIANQPKE